MTSKFKSTTRIQQRGETCRKIVDAAVASLIEKGCAATTTVEVQKRAQVSRGALLHHFPNHADLLASTVGALVNRNEEKVRRALALLPIDMDPVDRATHALADTFTQPTYQAELELWAVARTNASLRASLRAAEGKVRSDFDRVVAEVFAPVRNHPAQAKVIALSIELLRGMALACLLRGNERHQDQLLQHWSWAVRILLEKNPNLPTQQP